MAASGCGIHSGEGEGCAAAKFLGSTRPGASGFFLTVG